MPRRAAESVRNGGPDGAELFAEVVVEPTVEKRIGAGGTHSRHVANGVGDKHRLRVAVKRIERVVYHVTVETSQQNQYSISIFSINI